MVSCNADPDKGDTPPSVQVDEARGLIYDSRLSLSRSQLHFRLIRRDLPPEGGTLWGRSSGTEVRNLR